MNVFLVINDISFMLLSLMISTNLSAQGHELTGAF